MITPSIEQAHERIHVRKNALDPSVERELINLTDAVISVGRDLVQAIADSGTDFRRDVVGALGNIETSIDQVR